MEGILRQNWETCCPRESSIACSQILAVRAAAVRQALLLRALLTGTVPTFSCSSSAALLQQEWPAGEALHERPFDCQKAATDSKIQRTRGKHQCGKKGLLHIAASPVLEEQLSFSPVSPAEKKRPLPIGMSCPSLARGDSGRLRHLHSYGKLLPSV